MMMQEKRRYRPSPHDYTDEELSGLIVQAYPQPPWPRWHVHNLRKKDYKGGAMEQLLIDGWEPYAVDSGEFYFKKFA